MLAEASHARQVGAVGGALADGAPRSRMDEAPMDDAGAIRCNLHRAPHRDHDGPRCG
jgi:hypothetical protein